MDILLTLCVEIMFLKKKKNKTSISYAQNPIHRVNNFGRHLLVN